jgi:DNA-binding transcriptional LysR family regulator
VLDLHRLRVLRSVVASGSVGAAAANLGYTASAVSQHLSALQRETGLVLLERAGRGVRPTDAGVALAAEAEGVLARLGEAEALVADLRSGRSGVLSIAYFASVGSAWLPEVVAGLTGAFPDVRLDLRLADDAPEDPADRADVHLVVARDGFDPGRGFTAHHLLDEPYVVVVPAGHPLQDRVDVDLLDLEGERWVDNDFARGWCRRLLLDACAAAGFSPAFHVEAHDYRSAIAFVAAGVGITVLPALGAAQLPAGVVAVPVVRPTPVRSIHAIVRDATATSPGSALAVRLLTEVAGRR